MDAALTALLSRFGLPLVTLGALTEGDSVTMLAGAMAHRGVWPWWQAVLAAALGAWLSDQLWFHVGRRWRDGPRVQRLLVSRVGQRLAQWPSSRILLLYRAMFGTKTVGPIYLGARTFSPVTFAVVGVAVALVWAAVFTSLGFGVGAALWHGLERLGFSAHHDRLLLIAAGALALLAIWQLLRRRAA